MKATIHLINTPPEIQQESCHHIYITNEENIFPGDYVIQKTCIGTHSKVIKCETELQRAIANKEYNSGKYTHNKIILTTDPKLIKEGVQGIGSARGEDYPGWLINEHNTGNTTIEVYPIEICTNCGEQHCDSRNCVGSKEKKIYLISTPTNTKKTTKYFENTYCQGHLVESTTSSTETHYSAIEHLIIEWDIDGTKTAGHLTREILKILKMGSGEK